MENNEYNYSKYLDTPEKKNKFELRFKNWLRLLMNLLRKQDILRM